MTEVAREICLRMDDVGASSKQFEVYSRNRLANLFCLKYTERFRAWGPYEEMTPSQWMHVFEILDRFKACLTVGVTAAWVEEDNVLVPFPEKYSAVADILYEANNNNLIEIVNHGLSHCVIGKHLPRPFSSNRKYHREFWEWLDRAIHFEHIEKSQAIFSEWLGRPPTILVPPGNVYSEATVDACAEFGINVINSSRFCQSDSQVRIIGTEKVDAFHDRELVLEGSIWLENKLKAYGDHTKYVFVKDCDPHYDTFAVH